MTNSVTEAACFDRSKLLCCSYRGCPKLAVNKPILFYSILRTWDLNHRKLKYLSGNCLKQCTGRVWESGGKKSLQSKAGEKTLSTNVSAGIIAPCLCSTTVLTSDGASDKLHGQGLGEMSGYKKKHQPHAKNILMFTGVIFTFKHCATICHVLKCANGVSQKWSWPGQYRPCTC